MNTFVFLSLANVMAVGSVASYTDLRYGKVRNRLVVAGCAAGALIISVFYGRSFGPAYVAEVLTNGLLALGLSYALWLNRQWAAGDAKLFAFFAFFVPLSFYQKNYIAFFPSINILINAFCVAAVYILLGFLVFLAQRLAAGKAVPALKRFKARALLEPVRIALVFCLVLYALFLLGRVRFLLPLLSNSLAVFFLMYFLFKPLFANAQIVRILSVVSLCLLAYLFVAQSSLAGQLAARAAVYAVLIQALRRCLDLYIARRETANVRVRELKQGQVLAEGELPRIMGLMKEEERDDFNDTRSYGLNAGQLDIIRRLFKENDAVTVYRTLPLGPLLFGALLVTLLTRSSLIQMALQALEAFAF